MAKGQIGPGSIVGIPARSRVRISENSAGMCTGGKLIWWRAWAQASDRRGRGKALAALPGPWLDAAALHSLPRHGFACQICLSHRIKARRCCRLLRKPCGRRCAAHESRSAQPPCPTALIVHGPLSPIPCIPCGNAVWILAARLNSRGSCLAPQGRTTITARRPCANSSIFRTAQVLRR